MQSPPKRTLRLSSPHTKGEDVRRLQVAINARRRAGQITVDSEYGPVTAHAAKVTALALGIASGGIANGLGKHAQAIIRNPKLRTPVELYRARARATAAEKRKHSGALGAVTLALELARRIPHITETDGKNTDYGGIIDKMQAEVGIARTYWCGALVHWCLKHGGGIDVTPEVRYCPYTEAHAKNGTGGFLRWETDPFKAPVGSLVLYGTRQADHVEILTYAYDGSGYIRCVGGNTSAGEAGDQANGGGIFERRRPLTGGFPVRGFAVPRGL